MQGIFVSYRRRDAAGYVHALHDRLAERFGTSNVFIDLDSIKPGRDFLEEIAKALSSCSVVLALIGQRWAPERLRDAGDFVRLELSLALDRGLPVIPVLLEGASMPKPEELPEPLGPFARKNALEVSDLRFRSDVARLFEEIESISGLRAPASSPPPVVPSKEVLSTTQSAPIASHPGANQSSRLGLVGAGIGWLAAGFHLLMTIGILWDHQTKEDLVIGLSFIVSSGLLIAAAVMRLKRAKQTWKILAMASSWPLIVMAGDSLYLRDWSALAMGVPIFGFIFSLPFGLLAWRYRKLLRYGKNQRG